MLSLKTFTLDDGLLREACLRSSHCEDDDSVRRQVRRVDGRAVSRDSDVFGRVNAGIALQQLPFSHITTSGGEHDDAVIPAIRDVNEAIPARCHTARNMETPAPPRWLRPKPEQVISGSTRGFPRRVEPLKLVVVSVCNEQFAAW